LAEEGGMRLGTWTVWGIARGQGAVVGRFRGLACLVILSICGMVCLSVLFGQSFAFAMSLEREFVENLSIKSVTQESQVIEVYRKAKNYQIDNWTLFDMYLDEDRPFVRGEVLEGLEESVGLAQRESSGTLIIETFCDRRGTRAYSLALGHRRARQIQEFVQNLNVSQLHVHSTSYGNENLQCRETSRRCWEENIRMQSTFRYMAITEPKLGCLGRVRLQGNALKHSDTSPHHFLQKIHLAPSQFSQKRLHDLSHR